MPESVAATITMEMTGLDNAEEVPAPSNPPSATLPQQPSLYDAYFDAMPAAEEQWVIPGDTDTAMPDEPAPSVTNWSSNSRPQTGNTETDGVVPATGTGTGADIDGDTEIDHAEAAAEAAADPEAEAEAQAEAVGDAQGQSHDDGAVYGGEETAGASDSPRGLYEAQQSVLEPGGAEEQEQV
jgi:hypothetical protein